MTALWVAVAALVGTLVTALTAWWIERRKTSGRVTTTEADTLWAESKAIREELRNDRKALEAKVDLLSAKVTECHAEGAELRAQVAALRTSGQQ